MKVYVFMASDD